MSRCAEHDRILARFLDGEPLAGHTATDTLDAHLARCVECQTALREARRLDALLAQSARVEVTDALADRLFAHALPEPVVTHRSRWPLLLGAAAILLIGVGAGVLWQRATQPEPTPEPRPAPRVVHGPEPRLPTDLLPLPAPRRRGAARTRVTPQRLRDIALLRDPALAARVAPGLALGFAVRGLLGPTPHWSGRDWHAATTRATTTARVEAGLRLLRSRRADDRKAIEGFLAIAPDGPALRALLVHAVADRDFVRRLRGRLVRATVDSDVVRLAARLGDARLDDSLVRLGRKRPGHIDAIAMATVDLAVRPGRLALLFDLWALDRNSEPERRRWFRALPTASTNGLITTARTTRRVQRRLRAIEALGWRRDPDALGFLLTEVGGSHHECSLAAGHAISLLPRQSVESRVVAALRGNRRPHVLVAALCGMRSTWPRGHMRTSGLTAEETEFLWAGAFNRQQFGIACRLCRGRGVSAF